VITLKFLKNVGLSPKDLDIEPSQDEIYRMHSFTPQQGRYDKYTQKLKYIASEYEWVRRRLNIVVEYLIDLGDEFQNYYGTTKRLIEKPFSENQRKALRSLYTDFSPTDFKSFNTIDSKTHHDIVAAIRLGLYKMHKSGDIVDPVIMERAMHFGRTSDDVNANVFGTMLTDILVNYWLPSYIGLSDMFIEKAEEWDEVPEGYGRNFTVVAGQTHEQYAVPMPLKKIASNIVHQVGEGLEPFHEERNGHKPFRFTGKMGGAIGNDSAMRAAYPGHNWREFYRKFIEGFGLEYEDTSDQNISNMKILRFFQYVINSNNPLLKWADDYSSYLSRRVLKKKVGKESKGSSIMPQKINPWRTEGAEFFLEMANAELGVYKMLARQRKQGSLQRSVARRYIGVPFSNIVIAISRIGEDLKKTFPDYEGIEKELSEHPEIASASVQMILRAGGVPDAYDRMVDLTKGRNVTHEIIGGVIDEMVSKGEIAPEIGKDVTGVFRHENNVGDALEIADRDLSSARETNERIRKVYHLDV
jgi:adenylosuccinate lyase